MVLKQFATYTHNFHPFENDVKMYGTQTLVSVRGQVYKFENDVKMYGTQTEAAMKVLIAPFENDVKMYGTQTILL